jgi:hypothetical protein
MLGEIRDRVAQLEAAVEAQTGLYLDLGAAIERLTAELAVNTRERRETDEAIGRLARQHVELRRDLRLSDMHHVPRHSRRRPLG